MVRCWVGLVLCLFSISMVEEGAAQSRNRDRPIRVGNTNVFTIGGGINGHDHAQFDRRGFINFFYQRRVLRREMRVFPVWVRAALDFTSEAVDFDDAYTIWPAGRSGFFRERVQERTSDLQVRAELLADLLHGKNAALYGSAGFAIHFVSFQTRGLTSPWGIKSNESLMAPSLAAGGRLFMAKQPWTIYGEVRYGFVYGRNTAVWELGENDAAFEERPMTDQEFEFQHVNAISFEGGVGVHW